MGQPLRHDTEYEKDFAAWAEGQARLLRSGLTDRADLENIAEELDGLSRAERRQLRSCLTLIIMHMLKLAYQPEKASRSWLDTLHRERRHLERFLEDSPSLKAHLPKLFLEAYEDGSFEASKETTLDLDRFPAESPFSLAQVRDPDFVPPGIREG